MTAQQSEFNKQASALYRAYEQASLNAVLLDVRHHAPSVNTDAAYVHKMPVRLLIGQQWEFEFSGFYWHGTALSEIEARAAGWSAWLTKEGAEGYAR